MLLGELLTKSSGHFLGQSGVYFGVSSEFNILISLMLTGHMSCSSLRGVYMYCCDGSDYVHNSLSRVVYISSPCY